MEYVHHGYMLNQCVEDGLAAKFLKAKICPRTLLP